MYWCVISYVGDLKVSYYVVHCCTSQFQVKRVCVPTFEIFFLCVSPLFFVVVFLSRVVTVASCFGFRRRMHTINGTKYIRNTLSRISEYIRPFVM